MIHLLLFINSQLFKSSQIVFSNTGTPTWFLTLSANDLGWSDTVRPMFKLEFNREPTEDELTNLSTRQRVELINKYPAMAAEIFQRRVREIFKLLKSKNSPVGQVIDYAYRYEWQVYNILYLLIM